MKVAYLLHFRSGNTSGIMRKVASQAACWRTLGAKVGVFVATSVDAVAEWESLPEAVVVRTPPAGAFSLLREREHLARDVSAWEPDAIYTRHGLVYPGLLRLATRFPCIIEINGDDVAESRLVSRARCGFTRLTRGTLLRRAAGLVFVTNELSSMPSFARFHRPAVVIANGIDLEAVTPAPLPTNPEPRLIFVGHPRSPWHGLDHLEQLADAQTSWHFDVVGPGEEELARRHVNVVAHGLLAPADYLPILRQADVAIGSLAMYRAGIEEASTLKVREYLAVGLPAVVGYQDTDFMNGADFLLRIPNQPSGISSSLAEIERFVQRWRGRRVPREAIQHLDVSAKEQARLDFIGSQVDA